MSVLLCSNGSRTGSCALLALWLGLGCGGGQDIVPAQGASWAGSSDAADDKVPAVVDAGVFSPSAPADPFVVNERPNDQAQEPETCAEVSGQTKLLPLHLAVAFDVSGSMGQGDEPWHNRVLKWDPIVAALVGFFEAPAHRDIYAALTLFPGEHSERCEVDTYVTPDIPMTALPSPAFGELLTQMGELDSWRGGTPTLRALQGVGQYLDGRAKEQDEKEQDELAAVVLVTDGLPQDCENEDIEHVTEAARELSNRFPVYVIGVDNPPIEGAPDFLDNLQQIAKAGGTEQAYIIDTGEPLRTQADMARIVSEIRHSSSPCSAPIPAAPDGRVFDKQRVAVELVQRLEAETEGDELRSAEEEMPLEFEERSLVYDADCATPGAWHYDDPAAPSAVMLCDDVCADYRALPTAELRVAFGCEDVIILPD